MGFFCLANYDVNSTANSMQKPQTFHFIWNTEDHISVSVESTCLKKLEIVKVTGRNVSKLVDRSSEDQLLRLSELLFRSNEPLRVNPISVAFLRSWSKLDPANLRSAMKICNIRGIIQLNCVT